MFWSVGLRKVDSFFNAHRVYFYSVVLALITNLLGIAVYIQVPRFVESPGADFVQFYSAALLASGNPEHIYNVTAQKEMQKRFSAAARQGIYWPYIHAPFFTIILRPLSLFSYVGAFWIWTALTLVLYLGSVFVICRVDPDFRLPLGLTLALSGAAPVFYWLVITGQTTAIALCIWSAAFVLMKRSRVFLATFVLGLLSYRAQYLAVVVPLLVITRMWVGVLGIVASCVALIVVGGLVFSFEAYRQYVEAVLSQSNRITTLQQPYITLYGFFRPFLSHYASVAATIVSALPLIYWLLDSWRDPWSSRTKTLDLQWGLLMAVTLLLMHHGFVYDLFLLTVPMLLLHRYRFMLPSYYNSCSLFSILFHTYFCSRQGLCRLTQVNRLSIVSKCIGYERWWYR